MSNLDFATLQRKLPDESIVWGGFGTPINANLSAISGDEELTPESLVLETYGRLLDALLAVQNDINASRESPINLIQKTVLAQQGNPVFQWTVRIEVAASSSLDNPINPLAEAL
jgi:hypothetical protein